DAVARGSGIALAELVVLVAAHARFEALAGSRLVQSQPGRIRVALAPREGARFIVAQHLLPQRLGARHQLAARNIELVHPGSLVLARLEEGGAAAVDDEAVAPLAHREPALPPR